MATRLPVFHAQTLLIDADDTLWENNVYFERAIATFTALFESRCSTDAIRAALDEAEHECIRCYGYGSEPFGRALAQCCEHLMAASLTPEQRAFIDALVRSVSDHPIDLMPGVAETVPQLAARHRLILVTKGDAREQGMKLTRSGLGGHFSAVDVLREKDAAAYREVCGRHGLNCGSTWMIGNSPRSDVNPALAAGLHAIYIHHPATWAYEHDELCVAPQGQHLMKLKDFTALAQIFHV